MSKASKELAGALGEVVAAGAKEVTDVAKDGIINAIENMDEKYAKETLATLFPVLSLPVRILIVFMCMATVVLAGMSLYEFRVNPTLFDMYDIAVIVSLPLVGILLLAAVPIKSLAHGSAALGAELLRQRIQQHSERTGSSGGEVSVAPDTVADDIAPAAEHRAQTHSERSRP